MKICFCLPSSSSLIGCKISFRSDDRLALMQLPSPRQSFSKLRLRKIQHLRLLSLSPVLDGEHYKLGGWIARFFTVNSILVLFLDTTQNDGKSNANFKAVFGDCKAIRLFQAGYVSKIRLVRVGDVFFSSSVSARDEVVSRLSNRLRRQEHPRSYRR